MRAIVRKLRRDDSGLSLTELLVASFLTLLILVMVGNMFVSVTKITSASNQTRMSTDVATNVINEVTSVVRVATDISTDVAIASGSTSTKLVVYSLSNTTASAPAPSKITFELVQNPTNAALYDVKETDCDGTASGADWTFSSTCRTRVLGTGVMQSDSPANQLFTYRDGSGNVIAITATSSSTDRSNVASITVAVRSKAAGSNTNPVLVTNTVVLRNLGLDTDS